MWRKKKKKKKKKHHFAGWPLLYSHFSHAHERLQNDRPPQPNERIYVGRENDL